jgi:hypothetical protein
MLREASYGGFRARRRVGSRASIGFPHALPGHDKLISSASAGDTHLPGPTLSHPSPSFPSSSPLSSLVISMHAHLPSLNRSTEGVRGRVNGPAVRAGQGGLSAETCSRRQGRLGAGKRSRFDAGKRAQSDAASVWKSGGGRGRGRQPGERWRLCHGASAVAELEGE